MGFLIGIGKFLLWMLVIGAWPSAVKGDTMAAAVVVTAAITFGIADGIASRFNPVRFLLVVVCFLGLVGSLAHGFPPSALTLALLTISFAAYRYRNWITSRV